jgi:hypothetical protein
VTLSDPVADFPACTVGDEGSIDCYFVIDVVVKEKQCLKASSCLICLAMTARCIVVQVLSSLLQR